jgi:hypothetical protein
MLLAVGCGGDDLTQPGGERGGPQGGRIPATSANALLLAADARPLVAAEFRADSSDYLIALGTARLHGVAGDEVVLQARATRALLVAAGRDVDVVAEVSGTSLTFSLEAVTEGAVVYRFRKDETVEIRYWLSRRVAERPVGTFELRQYSGADVITSATPWVAPPSGGIDSVAFACSTNCEPCPLSAPTGSCGATSYAIVPYVPGWVFCCFQSDAGTGASNPITITFSEPVSSITITIQDPTWAGNTMTAYGPTGQVVGSVGFAFSGVPGVNLSDTKSISGSISSVILTPADEDYVAYSGLFMESIQLNVTCDSTSVVRGGAISCTAAPPTPGTLAIIGWSFTSTGGQRIERQVNPTSPTWSGTMALSGTIAAEGTVDGVNGTGSATVHVTSRTWTDSTLKSHMVLTPTTLSARPASMAGLGNFAGTLPLDPDINRWLATIGDHGPNHDFSYLIGLPPITTTASQVNTNAINGDSIFYQVQEPKRKKIGQLWYCPKSVVTGVLFSLVEKHEGAVSTPETFPNSHAAIFRAHVDSVAQKRYEPLVGFGGEDIVGPVSTAIRIEATNESAAMDTSSRNYITYQSLGNCETFHFTYPP